MQHIHVLHKNIIIVNIHDVTFCHIIQNLSCGSLRIMGKECRYNDVGVNHSIGSLLSEKRPRITTATKQRVVIIGRFTALPYKLMVLLIYDNDK